MFKTLFLTLATFSVTFSSEGFKNEKTNYHNAFKRIEAKNHYENIYNNPTESEIFFDDLQKMQNIPAVEKFLLSFINSEIEGLNKKHKKQLQSFKSLQDKIEMSVNSINDMSGHFSKIQEQKLVKYYNEVYADKDDNIEKYLKKITENQYKNEYLRFNMVNSIKEVEQEKSTLSTKELRIKLLSAQLRDKSRENLSDFINQEISVYNDTKFFKWDEKKKNSIARSIQTEELEEQMFNLNAVKELKNISFVGTDFTEHHFGESLAESKLNKDSRNFLEKQEKENENAFDLMFNNHKQRLNGIKEALSSYPTINSVEFKKTIQNKISKKDTLFSCCSGN